MRHTVRLARNHSITVGSIDVFVFKDMFMDRAYGKTNDTDKNREACTYPAKHPCLPQRRSILALHYSDMGVSQHCRTIAMIFNC